MDSDGSGLTLRPAGASDEGEVKRLVRQARLNPFGLDWRRFTLLENQQGRVVGCVQVKPHGGGAQELASLVIAPDWRGQGLGSNLVRHVQAEAGPPLWLMCAPNLKSYYRQFGFRPVDDGSVMAPYFRRIHYLSQMARFITQRAPVPLIMLWEGD